MAAERPPVQRGAPKSSEFHYLLVENNSEIDKLGIDQHSAARDRGYEVDEKFGQYVRYKKPLSEHKKDLVETADQSKRMLRSSVLAKSKAHGGDGTGIAGGLLSEVDFD